MANLSNIRSKISNALFSTFGEQGFLIKNGIEFNVYVIEQEKTFSVENRLLSTGKKTKINSLEKPELYDLIKINGVTKKIAESPTKVDHNIYEIKLK